MICRQCGKDNLGTSAFCSECGAPLDATGDSTQESPTTVIDYSGGMTPQASMGYDPRGGFSSQSTQNSSPIGYDQVGNAIYAYDASNNPIYGYDQAGHPIYGFDQTGQPIFGYDTSGNAVYGFDQFNNPITAASTGGATVPPATEGNGGGLSSGAKIGIIAGVGIVIVALVVVICVLALGGGGGKSDNAANSSSNPGNVSVNVSVNGGSDSSTSSGSSSTKNSTSSSATATKTNTVNLTANTKSGGTVSGTVRRDSNGYVLPDSENRVYSVSELRAKGLTDAELCVAWNEPYARLGRHFNNSSLQKYFESCSWYVDRGFTGDPNSNALANAGNLKSLLTDEGWRNLVAY